MTPILELFGLTALLGGVATVCGRMVAIALHAPLVRRSGTESLLVSAFLGTGFLMLTYGWGSYLGLAAGDCLVVVVLSGSGLAALLACRRCLGEAFRFPRPRWYIGVVAIAMGVRAATYWLPVGLGSCYNPYCDSAQYVAIAEWLQVHGFGTPPSPDPHQPVHPYIHRVQELNHRMGPMFLLALVRAVLRFRTAAELFPVVMAWGTALNVAGIFVLARWGLGVPRFAAVVGTAAVAVALNSLNYSAAEGFLCQVYGTAALAFGLAQLARLHAAANWRPGNAALFGLSFATLLSMYSELAPILALAASAAGGWALWRAPRCRLGHFARFAGVVLLAILLFGNIESVRAVRSVCMLISAPAGYPIPWTNNQFARFALGFYPYYLFGTTDPVPGHYLIGAAVAGTAFLLGLLRAFRDRQALPLGVACCVFTGMVIVHLGMRDPWTGAVGHSWRLFKLGKWVFTLVAALEVAGLWLLLRRCPWPRLAGILVAAALVWAAVPMQLDEARHIAAMVGLRVGGDAGFRGLGQLVRRMDARAPRRLYYVSEPSDSWPRCLAAYLLNPRPFANGWKGSKGFGEEWLVHDLPEAFEPGTLFFQYGAPPFSPPMERLPFNYSIVDRTRPLLFRVENPNGLEGRLGAAFTWVGKDPLVLFVFSPWDGPAVLSFLASAGPCLPETSRRSLRLTDERGTAHDATVEAASGTTVAFPVTLTRGINRLELRCLDQPTTVHPTDPRVLLVRVEFGCVHEAEAVPVAGLSPTSPRAE
jgi:hypothetical protein